METIKSIWSTATSPVYFVYNLCIPDPHLDNNIKHGAIWLGLTGIISSIAMHVFNTLPLSTILVLEACSVSLTFGGLTGIPIFIYLPLIGAYSYGCSLLASRVQHIMKK